MQPTRLFGVAFLLVTALGCEKRDTASPMDAPACTEEAMICPDGSSVGRSGPDCAFAPCPTESDPASTEPSEDPEGDEPSEEDEAED